MGIDRVRSWPYPATSIKDKATRDYLISLYNALSDESRSGITDAQAILDGVESDYIPLISSPATNHFPYQTAAGALIDSGYDAADFATDDHNHDSAYISIIASPETNHFPYQTAGGELTDSGYDAADFATAGHNHDSAYISIIASPETNHFPYQTAGGELTDSGYDAADFATAGHNHDSAYISIIGSPAANHFAYQTAGGELIDSGYDATDFEPDIAIGTSAQYWRGDKSWQTLNQAAVDGLTTTDGPSFNHAHLTVATGTAPLTITSTTVCSNLNADLWDGYQFADYLDQAVKQTSSPTFSGETLSGLTASQPVVTGASKELASMSYSTLKGWLAIAAADVSGLTPDSSPTFVRVTLTQEVGTAPLTITSTTVCSNLNADLWDGYQFADYLDQAVKQTSSPTFVTVKCSDLTTNYIPYHVDDATGLADSPLYVSGGLTYSATRFNLSADGMALSYSKTQTDPATGSVIVSLQSRVDYTGPETASESFYLINASVKPVVNAGHTNSSGIDCARYNALRNIAAASVDDDGTLASLAAQTSYYGHSNLDATANPHTTSAYGLRIYPLIRTGTIGTMTDILLAADATGGSYTYRYGIRQLNSGWNLFTGNIGLGKDATGTPDGTNSLYVTLGTPSSKSHTNTFIMYGADFAAGNTCPYFRTENGTVIGLNQSLLTTDNVTFVQGTFTTLTSPAATDLTIAPTDDIIIDPVSNMAKTASGVRIQSDNYASQTTGWGISYAGSGDFRYVYADELHAKAFIADLEQALAGGQIICKSVAPLASDFTVPAAEGSASLVVESFKGFDTFKVFVDGDMVRLRQFARSGTSLTISNCWGTVVWVSTDTDAKTQTYTFTRSADPNAGTASGTIYAGTLALDYGTTGNGYLESNAIDGSMAENAPYHQVVSWDTHPNGGLTVRTRLGNLNGIFATANEYGLFAGDGILDASKYLRISDQAAELHNISVKLYDGAANTVLIEPTTPSLAIGATLPTGFLVNDGIWMGKDTVYKFRVGAVSGGVLTEGVSWDGTTLDVKGTVTATLGYIGGWTIAATSLTDTAGTTGMSSAVTAGDDIRFWAGNATPADAPFKVTEAGALTATSGAIGGFTLAANQLSSGTDADYVAMSSGGTNAFWAGDSTFADAPFSVTAAGALKATSGTIGGWTIGAADISATYAKLASGAGSGYVSFGNSAPTSYGNNVGAWLGYSSGAKLSLYSDTSNYLQWDGSNLHISIGGVGGLVPEGTIVAWVPGYFTDATNGGYTEVFSVAAMYYGVGGWYTCSGQNINVSDSQIFNGANRYLPNLTDDRFLMGDTAAGATGGSSSSAHTHSFADTSTSGGAHTHTVSGTSGAGSSHKHEVNVASTTSGGPSATSGKYAPDPSGAYLVPAALHTHDTNPASVDSATEAAHTHGAGSYGAGSDGAHTHDVSGTTGAASATENRPKYLSVYYIMYVGRGEGGVLLPG